MLLSFKGAPVISGCVSQSSTRLVETCKLLGPLRLIRLDIDVILGCLLRLPRTDTKHSYQTSNIPGRKSIRGERAKLYVEDEWVTLLNISAADIEVIEIFIKQFTCKYHAKLLSWYVYIAPQYHDTRSLLLMKRFIRH
jgi:hypothetical protein